MILIDSSIIIDKLRFRSNEKTALFDSILEQGIPYALPVYTYLEVLQGARDDREFAAIKLYIGSQRIVHPENDLMDYERAASIYSYLRQRGITVRSSVDVLIVSLSLRFDAPLLHNDRDFDVVEKHLPAFHSLCAL